MAEILSTIGNFIGSPAGKGVLATAGLGSNIYSGVQQAQENSTYKNAQSYLANLMQNPTAFNTAAQQYIQPLNQGLVTGITNQTNAQLAERGLGGSSAITQQTLAQALAPYIQQNQQAGQQTLLSLLGQTGALRPSGANPMTNITQLLASLRGGTTGAPTATPANLGLAAPTGPSPIGIDTSGYFGGDQSVDENYFAEAA